MSKHNCRRIVLTDPPTIICIKHNGDEKSEDSIRSFMLLTFVVLTGA